MINKRIIISSLLTPLIFSFILVPLLFVFLGFGRLYYSSLTSEQIYAYLKFAGYGFFICIIISTCMLKLPIKEKNLFLVGWLISMLLIPLTLLLYFNIFQLGFNFLLTTFILGFLISHPFYLIFWCMGFKKWSNKNDDKLIKI